MNARWIWPPLALLLASWGFAQSVDADPQGKSRLAEFQRDSQLIEAFVNSGLELAAENDPLQRARLCEGLADRLAQEMRQATARSDGTRTADLGWFYQDVLVRGVADNLTVAHKNVAPDSPRAKEIVQVGDKVALIAKPLEQDIQTLPPENKETMQETLQGIFQAKQEVANSVQGKGRSSSDRDDGHRNDDRDRKKGKAAGKGKGKRN